MIPPLHSVGSEPPAPWSCEGVAHRVVALETIIARHEGRMNAIEAGLMEHKEEVASLIVTHETTLATLVKMQETLELMKEVLTTYNKAKGFVSVFGSVGGALIFVGKVFAAGCVLYVAVKFGKLPT